MQPMCCARHHLSATETLQPRVKNGREKKARRFGCNFAVVAVGFRQPFLRGVIMCVRRAVLGVFLWALVGFVWLTVGEVSMSRAAETGGAQSQSESGRPEQTPEQAAGGFRNMMRIKSACEADARRFCPDVKPGGGRILQCLRQHDAELAPGCREAVAPPAHKP